MNKIELKLNIGSGYKRIPDYLNIDADSHCFPDISINLDDENLILPFPDNSVTNIIAHHILEHIGTGYFRLLQEIYRICTEGAIIDIRVPHHNHEVFLNDPTHQRPITVEGMRLFSKKFNNHTIETSGSSSTLGIMYDVDYEIVHFDFVYDSFYDTIIKSNTPEQNYKLLRECINTTIETHIILTVLKD